MLSAAFSTLSSFGIGMALWANLAAPLISDKIYLGFMGTAAIMFTLGWLRALIIHNWPAFFAAGVAGGILVVNGYATYIHKQSIQSILEPTALVVFLALHYFTARTTSDAPFRWYETALIATYSVTCGAFITGSVQIASVLLVILGVTQVIFWVNHRSMSARNMTLGLIFAVAIPLAMTLLLRIDHMIAVPWTASLALGLFLFWLEFLRLRSPRC